MVLTQVLADDFRHNPLQHLAHHREQGDGLLVAGLRPRVLIVDWNHSHLLQLRWPLVFPHAGGEDSRKRTRQLLDAPFEAPQDDVIGTLPLSHSHRTE